MLFKTTAIVAYALFMASQVMGAAIDSPVQDIAPPRVLIATDPCM